MATREPRLLRDGFLSLPGGIDSGRSTNLLAPTKAAYASNVSFRGGFARTRHGFKKRTLDFATDEVRDWFTDQFYQVGGDVYYPEGNNPRIIVSVGGRIFSIDVLDDYKVTDLTPIKSTTTTSAFTSPAVGSTATVDVTSADTILVGSPATIGGGTYTVTVIANNTLTIRNNSALPGVNVASGTPVYFLDRNAGNLPTIWTKQAEKWFVIQNGSGAAILYDGATARRAKLDGANREVPTGTAMEYWQGRLWVAVNGREIAAGDIAGGPSDVIKFTETQYLAEGGKFRVPKNAGEITAIVATAVLDTSLGQGPLQVFTETTISTLNLPVNRARWKDLDSPLQTAGLINYGATSQHSTVIVNSDVFFRAKDGVRSFVIAQREFGTWGNTPLSREMRRAIAEDTQALLRHGSAVLFDNRLFMTVSPLPYSYGAYWRGLGVLDFDLLSGIGEKAPPTWEGSWNGANILQILKGTFTDTERCFMFVRNSDGENELWEMDPNDRFDNDRGRITSFVETRAMDFSKPLDLKRMEAGELWIDNVEGEVDITLKYKPDQYPCWGDWGTAEACSTVRSCATNSAGCLTLKNYKPGYKPRIGFGQPPDDCESLDNKPFRNGYQFEARIEWTGSAQIKTALFKATELSEPTTATCD